METIIKRNKRLFAVMLLIALSLSAVGINPVPKTLAKETVDAENDDENISKRPDLVLESTPAPTVPPIVNAYDLDSFEKMTAEDAVRYDIGDVKTEDDYDNQGMVLKATAKDIEAGEISIVNEVDFSAGKVGRVIFDGLCERKKQAVLNLYLDGDTTPFASIDINVQNGKDIWTKKKNASIDISSKNITGKHKLRMKISFKDLSESDKNDKTKLLFRQLAFMAFDIPTINLQIDESQGTIAEMNNDSDHKTECYGNMKIEVPSGYVNEYGGENSAGTYEMEYIRGRGNSTWGPSKKPYKIKLDKSANLFGQGKSKHWVLLANYYDYTMLRNKYTYMLGDQMNMEFTPQCTFVNVVMNGQYLGSYYLSDHVRVGKACVDIDDLEDTPDVESGEELTGGYLLSMDYGKEQEMVATQRGMNLYIESPEITGKKGTTAQHDYIQDYCQKVEDALYGDDFKDTEGHSYMEYMDVDSAIDFYLIQEFSLNGDGFSGGSNYLYKKRGDKLYWGPLWDFDYVAWGATEIERNQTDGFIHNNTLWFDRMFQDPVFFAKFKERWNQVKTIIAQSVADGGGLDKLAEKLNLSQMANYKVASSTLIDDMDYEYAEDIEKPTFSSEVERLKSWVRERLDWFDKHIDEVQKKTYKITLKVGKKKYKVISTANNYVDAEELPLNPKKKGYNFVGWYAKKGKKYGKSIIDTVIKKDMTFYAKWEKNTKGKNGDTLFCPVKEVYLPNYYASYVIPVYSYSNRVPQNMIKWSSSDPNTVYVDQDGAIQYNEGIKATVTITAKYNKKKVKVKVHIFDDGDIKYPKSIKLKKTKITVKKNTYKRINYTISPKKFIPEEVFYDMKFCSSKPSVVSVDEHGVLLGKKKGKATVAVVFKDMVKLCTVTVK
ncbi:MAG: CotH kinase family protein [Eubacterium sp.]|nr:CotH kinase family protein [Eubacterium sp.]